MRRIRRSHATMPRIARQLIVVATLFASRRTSSLGAQQSPQRLSHFLQETLGLDAKELAALDRGEPVLQTLPTLDRRDVAVFGVIATAVSRETYTQRLRDVQSWLPRPSRTHYGVFSDPPSGSDVRTLTLDPRGIDDLRKCQPHECDIKLPAVEMQKFRELIDASLGDALAAITQYAKQRLVTYVAGYRMRGDSALTVYDDERAPVHASDAFDALLAQSAYMYQDFPALARYLTAYPRAKLDSLSEAIYWSEDVAPRLKPIISLTHVVVVTPPELQLTFLASKQLYADHYFEGAFELMIVVDRPSLPGESATGSYLLVLRRYRFDSMPNSRFIDMRGRVVGGLRDVLLADLMREKTATEKGNAR